MNTGEIYKCTSEDDHVNNRSFRLIKYTTHPVIKEGGGGWESVDIITGEEVFWSDVHFETLLTLVNG